MSFKKYPKIERLGSDDNRDILAFPEDTLVVEEKVDGGNGSFWLEEDGVHFGKRNGDLTADEDVKTFAKQQVALRDCLDGKKIKQNYIYYIEWMAPHTVNYTDAPDFIGYDIRVKKNMEDDGCGLFIGRELREKEFERLGIENIPISWRGTVKDFKKKEVQDLIPKSKYYDGKAEGIVIKNYCRKHPRGNHQLYAKVVTAEFRENNKAVFGGIRQKNTDTQKIVDEFVTEARVRKAVLKFVNEDGMKLELALMKHVPVYIIKDILAEEFGGIFERYRFVDFSEMKKRVARICLNCINTMMVEKSKGKK